MYNTHLISFFGVRYRSTYKSFRFASIVARTSSTAQCERIHPDSECSLVELNSGTFGDLL